LDLLYTKFKIFFIKYLICYSHLNKTTRLDTDARFVIISATLWTLNDNSIERMLRANNNNIGFFLIKQKKNI